MEYNYQYTVTKTESINVEDVYGNSFDNLAHLFPEDMNFVGFRPFKAGEFRLSNVCFGVSQVTENGAETEPRLIFEPKQKKRFLICKYEITEKFEGLGTTSEASALHLAKTHPETYSIVEELV